MSTISIVVPVFNEQENLASMHQAILAAWVKLPRYALELIFVDDGSTDQSWSEIIKLNKRDRRVLGISFVRNFGQEAAIEAGLRYSKGAAVIVMDGDLQHPPELIIKLVKAWEDGFQVVNTERQSSGQPSLIKRWTSILFYKVFNVVSDVATQPGMADFRLLDRRVVDEINQLTEKQKFFRGLIGWLGFRSTIIPYSARERTGGQSSYSLKKMVNLARVGIISSSTMPMTIIFTVGCFLMILGLVITTGLLFYKYFVDYEYIGAAAVLGAFIILNNGILMMAFGVMSLYQVATYREVQNRPTYIVREEINHESSNKISPVV